MVYYGFPWDTNTGLLGRSPWCHPTSLLWWTSRLLIRHCWFCLGDHLHNCVSFIQIPAHYYNIRTVHEYSLKKENKSLLVDDLIKWDDSIFFLFLTILFMKTENYFWHMVVGRFVFVSKVKRTIFVTYEMAPHDPGTKLLQWRFKYLLSLQIIFLTVQRSVYSMQYC